MARRVRITYLECERVVEGTLELHAKEKLRGEALGREILAT